MSEKEILEVLASASLELADLPPDMREQRLKTIESGLSLVGRVLYFWGGRSFSPGWNDRWGSMQKIQHVGSKNYKYGGSYPYGLDCGGFVFWAVLTSFGKDSQESPVEWMAGLTATGIYNGSHPVTWEEKRPGDLVVNTPLTYIEILSAQLRKGKSYISILVVGKMLCYQQERFANLTELRRSPSLPLAVDKKTKTLYNIRILRRSFNDKLNIKVKNSRSLFLIKKKAAFLYKNEKT